MNSLVGEVNDSQIDMNLAYLSFPLKIVETESIIRTTVQHDMSITGRYISSLELPLSPPTGRPAHDSQHSPPTCPF